MRKLIVILVLSALLPLVGAVDLDGDGLNDVWELMFGAENLAPDTNLDADSLTNFEESVAGTDPRDGASNLGIARVETLPSGAVGFSWPSAAGKRYEVFGNSELSPVGWVSLGIEVIGTGGILTVPVPEGPERYFRLQVSEQDRDGDGLSDWEEAQLGLDPMRVQSVAGTDDMDRAIEALTAPVRYTIRASEERIREGEAISYTVSRSGGLVASTVGIQYMGQLAPPERDWPQRLSFENFETEQVFTVTPRRGDFPASEELFTVSLALNESGQEPTPSADVRVSFSDPTFFAAQLRTVGASHVPVWGYATLAIDLDRTRAELRWEIEGFQREPGVPTFRIGGKEVPWTADSEGRRWIVLDPSRLAAIEDGEATITLSSERPASGLQGTFHLADGDADPFVPPALQGWTPNGLPSAEEAARFLGQATFGPRMEDIQHVQDIGFEAWIDEQLALPASHHTDQLLRWAEFGFPPGTGRRSGNWWQVSLTAPDQLRQRVAFALTEFFVISDRFVLFNFPLAVVDYQDMLVDGAFGSFRELLEDVSLHPAMGMYLSHVRNPKGDATRQPDENYAREVMQLFSVGLWKLTPDGGRVIGPAGLPQPTYGQDEVRDMARVFTGWSYPSDAASENVAFWFSPVAEREPLKLYPSFHDDGEKELLDGLVLPAGQGGRQDLSDALDMLAAHPNTAPFVSRFLIQRLVTSNPSPGYIYRVARAFQDRGGHLGAVVKAILLDPEARNPGPASEEWFGHLREPLLRATALMRAFHAQTPTAQRVHIQRPRDFFVQGTLQAPSVFNFFEPDSTQPGPVADAGLHAPEFKILTANEGVLIANSLLQTLEGRMESANEFIAVDLSAELALATDPDALLDRLDVLLLHGRLTEDLRREVRTAMAAVPASDAQKRVETAIYLLLVSPEHTIFR